MILSIHIISQVGYILAGFSMLTLASIAAGIYYLIHNILVKANLFLMGGVSYHFPIAK